MSKELYDLKNSFLQEWPIERLEKMTLEEYTNLNKTSFCYWVEAITYDLGSIWRGSSYKFGVYKRRDKSKKAEASNRIFDGEYAWYSKYGNTREEAFDSIKKIILEIKKNASNGDLGSIDSIDLGDSYKWKIAFLYGDFISLNLFKQDALLQISKNHEVALSKKATMSELNSKILEIKPIEEDYFEFTKRLWKEVRNDEVNVKTDFANWLNENTYDSYRNYLGGTIDEIIKKLDEINSFFEDIDLFLIDKNKINQFIKKLLKLLSKKERAKRADFEEYDLKQSNGIPKAILGKNNYVKFLREKFHIIDNTETKNYFWVNQGKRYEVEHKYSCIAATQKNLHHHKRLKEIKKGDVFIHYAHSSILATSVAIESCKIMPRPYEPDGEDCLVVKVNYSILENPIPFIDIKEIFLNKKYLLPKKGGPFNYNLGIVQSYCLSFNKPSYLAIFSKNFNNSTIMSNEPNLNSSNKSKYCGTFFVIFF